MATASANRTGRPVVPRRKPLARPCKGWPVVKPRAIYQAILRGSEGHRGVLGFRREDPRKRLVDQVAQWGQLLRLVAAALLPPLVGLVAARAGDGVDRH